jgi:hypothetical protein
MAAIPDGTAAGGNARGANAVDLQTARSAASQVASGADSITIGVHNTASNSSASAIGFANTVSGTGAASAIGSQNAVSGTSSFAAGLSNTAGGSYTAVFGNSNNVSDQGGFSAGQQNVGTGNYSVLLGFGMSDRGNTGGWFQASSNFGRGTGDTSAESYVLACSTSGASCRLTSDGTAAGAHNVIALANNSAMMFSIKLVALDRTTQKAVTFAIDNAVMTRGANAAATAMGIGVTTFAAGGTSSAPPTIATLPTVSADTINGGFNVTFTTPAGNSDSWDILAFVRGVFVQ